MCLVTRNYILKRNEFIRIGFYSSLCYSIYIAKDFCSILGLPRSTWIRGASSIHPGKSYTNLLLKLNRGQSSSCNFLKMFQQQFIPLNRVHKNFNKLFLDQYKRNNGIIYLMLYQKNSYLYSEAILNHSVTWYPTDVEHDLLNFYRPYFYY